ncbi:MAG: hypothetical protein LAO18_01975 [Acidobacteriia bacterium]|nr:hypothetical protein [Terriglobia bacterium]
MAESEIQKLTKEPSFLLTKWYLDCVDESGDAAIVYVANLRWNKLSIRYGSLLTVLDGRAHSSSSLRKCAFPRLEGDTTTLTLPHLGIMGTWRALRAPVKRTVFDGEDGSADWHCHQPMAQVDLLLQGKTRMTGLGYAECLTLSVLPWKLPLEELHWGRFLSEQDALVWIDWRGPQPWRTLIHNSEEHEIQSLTESEILFAPSGTSLELDRGLVLRSGQLGQTVFAGVSHLAKLLPHNMLSVEECKWRSRGVLQTGNSSASGWAIHEIVKWK